MGIVMPAVCPWSIGIGVGPFTPGCAGIGMPSIGDVDAAGAAPGSCGFAALARFFTVAFGFGFPTTFFFAACLVGIGMVMPGMFICAIAGVARTARATHGTVRLGKTFRRRPRFEKRRPRRAAEGAPNRILAAAVLAGAGIAAAAALRATAIPLRFDILAILHFKSPF